MHQDERACCRHLDGLLALLLGSAAGLSQGSCLLDVAAQALPPAAGRQMQPEWRQSRSPLAAALRARVRRRVAEPPEMHRTAELQALAACQMAAAGCQPVRRRVVGARS